MVAIPVIEDAKRRVMDCVRDCVWTQFEDIAAELLLSPDVLLRTLLELTDDDEIEIRRDAAPDEVWVRSAL